MNDVKNKREIEFLRAEVLAGLTFSKIALESQDQEKADRNRAKARKAYDSLLHFMPRFGVTESKSAEILGKVAELKSRLQQLGEDV